MKWYDAELGKQYSVAGHTLTFSRQPQANEVINPRDFAEIDGKPVEANVGDPMPYWLAEFCEAWNE